MTAVPPKIDSRTLDDLIEQTEKLAKDYTASSGPGWSPNQTGSRDLGSTLIHLFSRMVKQAIDRLNQVPEKNHLAFLNLLGAERLPPRAARVPLTFRRAKGSTSDVIVPTGTQVSAAAEGTKPEAIFETEQALFLSRAELKAVIAWQPGASKQEAFYEDCSARATGSAPGDFPPFEASSSGQQGEHVLYLACDKLLALPGLTQFTVGLKADSGSSFDLDWSSWDGQNWTKIAPKDSSAQDTHTCSIANPQTLCPRSIMGQSAHWVRASLRSSPKALPKQVHCTAMATVARKGIPLDQVVYEGRAFDLSRDYQPFGAQPCFNDVFYLACDEAFGIPGNKVTLHVLTTKSTQARASKDLRIAWEACDGGRWISLGTSLPNVSDAAGSPTSAGPDPKDASTTSSTDRTVAPHFSDNTNVLTADGTVTLTLPAKPALATIGGQTAFFVRARIIAGNYGEPARYDSDKKGMLESTFLPPSIQSITVDYEPQISRDPLTKEPQVQSDLQACISQNDLDFVDCTTDSRTDGKGCEPFRFREDKSPALYLGFDQPFENQPMSLFLDRRPGNLAKDDPTRGAPNVCWEYRSAGGWNALHVTDDTQALTRSGLVQFIGPPDACASMEHGQKLFWLRIRLESGGYRVWPRMGRILLNTTWASHAETHRQELLGSSNGSRDQVFRCSQTPVLLGQCIEVRESDSQWKEWQAVPDFHSSGPQDRHYVLDSESGQVCFGNGVRGQAPPAGADNIRATCYRTGGGLAGNRPTLSVCQLKSTIPYVDGAINYVPATGGADVERLDSVKQRAGKRLRHQGLAVTVDDFADLAFEASPAVERAVAVGPVFDPLEQSDRAKPNLVSGFSEVLVMILPYSDSTQPTPDEELVRTVQDYLKARCAPAVNLRVVGPTWIQVSVTATIAVSATADADEVCLLTKTALDRYLHPLTGGKENAGWPLGRRPAPSDLYALLSEVPGVTHVEKVTVVCPGMPEPHDELPIDWQRRMCLVCTGSHQLTLGQTDQEKR